MRGNLWHTVVEWWRFYFTWLVYIIGTEQILLLLEIRNGYIICDFACHL